MEKLFKTLEKHGYAYSHHEGTSIVFKTERPHAEETDDAIVGHERNALKKSFQIYADRIHGSIASELFIQRTSQKLELFLFIAHANKTNFEQALVEIEHALGERKRKTN